MNSNVAAFPSQQATRSRALRLRVLTLLGPLTVAAGFVWALVQPWRLTLLHPHGQGFWWLVIEPQLLVMVAGLAFSRYVVRPLVADVEELDAAAR